MTMQFPQTLVASVEEKLKSGPDDVCFCREGNDTWEPVTHQQFYDDVQAISRSLLKHGVEKGDRIGILARPCYEWEVADKAVLYLGGIVVGLDCRASPGDITQMLQATNPKGLFVEDSEHLAILAEYSLRSLRFLCLFEESTNPDGSGHASFWDVAGQNRTGDHVVPRARPEDVGVAVFTSGTTGKPKAIALTHAQLTASLPDMYEIFRDSLGSDDRTIAWVPLYNSTGRLMGTINYYLGVSQYFIRDPQRLFEKIKKVNPDYLVVFPRILEKVHEQVQARVRERSGATRLMLKSLLTFTTLLPGRRFKRFADWLLLGKLRRAIWGDRIQFLISGSAPMDAGILRFFDAMGVPIYESYGLSEISSIVSMNRPGQVRYGSVGRPLKIVDVKIAGDREILAKTSAAMKSYLGDMESDLFEERGYLRTGDLGEFRDGYLYIIGRKKEIIKTSTGQRISPVQIEGVYRDIPGIDQIVVVGNGQKYLTALVTLNEQFKGRMNEQRFDVGDYLAAEFRKRSNKLAATRQIKKFTVLPRTLSVAEGEITATLKLRRAVIEDKYRGAIDSMYRQ